MRKILLCLLLCCSLSASQRVTFDIRQLSISAITSNGSCIDVYPVALNCTLPATLSVHIQGVPPYVAQPTYLRFVVYGDLGETYFYAYVDNNSSMLTGSVKLGGYSVDMLGRLLSVAAVDINSGNRSQSFLGVSIAFVPPPVFTSIQGCEGSGLATHNCRVDQDTVVLQGTGLTIFNSLVSYELIIGNSAMVVYPGRGGLQPLNDSFAILFLNSTFQDVLTESQYTGVAMDMSANLRWYSRTNGRYYNNYTNSMTISFAALPPPVVTSYSFSKPIRSLPTCILTSAGVFSSCIPGGNTINIQGLYLLNATAALCAEGLGCWLCERIGPVLSSRSLQCRLPMIPTDRAGQSWDVTVTTTTGSVIMKDLITFAVAPSIASLVPCNPSPFFPSAGMFCPPNASLTIHGSRFLPDPNLIIQLAIPDSWLDEIPLGGSNFSCSQSIFVSNNTLICVMPTLSQQLAVDYYGTTSYLRVLFPTYGVSTVNTAQGLLFAFPDSPRITLASGCESSNSNMELSRCRGGDVVTVYGSHFNGTSVSISFGELDGNGYGTIAVISGWTESVMQLQLPFMDGGDSDVQEDYPYLVQWLFKPYGRSVAVANSFQISFTWDSRFSSAQTSSSRVLLAAVLVPTLFIGIVLVAWLLLRRTRLRARWQTLRTDKVPDSLRSDNHFEAGVELR